MVIKYGQEGNEIYHEPCFCAECNKDNKFVKQYNGLHGLEEAKTVCTVCGHQNYWAYGNFTMPYIEKVSYEYVKGDK